MKLRSLIGLTTMAAIVMGLAACDWSGSSDSDTTFTRYDGWNFSGSYRATEESAAPYTQFIVHQSGNNITLTDNRGGRYTGKVTKQVTRPWTPDTSTAEDTGIAAYSASSSTLKYYFVTESFEVSGVSGRGRSATIVGTFETTQYTSTESAAENVSVLMAATIIEQGGGTSGFTGTGVGLTYSSKNNEEAE